MAKAARAARPKAKDALDQFASAGAERALQLVLWKGRHQNPEMTVLVSEADLRAFDECMHYQKVTPEILLYRPEGRPAQAAIPAAGNRRAVPGRSAEPPRPYVIVGLVERGTHDAVKPVENNAEDYGRGELARQVQVVKRNLTVWASELRRAAVAGDFSSSTLEEVARALELWART